MTSTDLREPASSTIAAAAAEPVETTGGRGDRPEPIGGHQVVRATAWVLVGSAVVLQVVAILRASQAWLLLRMPDDAFYYLEVGRRLGEGEGPTFDGINETNGFHPLWQGLVAVLSVAVPSPDAQMRAVLLLGVAMSVLAVALVGRVVGRVAGSTATLVGCAVALVGGLGPWSNGMEGPAVLLALALVLTALVRWTEEPGTRRAVAVGLACALCVLARFDLLAVVWLVPAAMAWRERAWRVLLPVAAGLAAIGAPLGAAWLLRFGSPLTTSATVKAHWLDSFYEDRFGGRASVSYLRFLAESAADYVGALADRVRPGAASAGRALVLALAGLGLVGALRDRRRSPRAEGRWVERLDPAAFGLATIVVVVAAKAVVDLLSAPLWASAWYAAPQQLALLLAVGVGSWLAVERLARSSVAAAVVVAALLGALLLPTNAEAYLSTDAVELRDGVWQHEMERAAAWIIEEGPEGRYGARDAGLLGFRLHGDRTLVNLDGLVNDYEFAELVAAEVPLRALLRIEGIDHYVNRTSAVGLDELADCARTLWRSEASVPYGDAIGGSSDAHVYVLDVRSC